MKVLLTGIAGTGKTTALAELQKRGFAVIELDATGMCRWKNKTTGEFTWYGEAGQSSQWLAEHGWYCDIDTLKKLLSCIREDKDIFVAVIAENVEDVAHEFDKVFVFTAGNDVIKERLARRSNNNFAKQEEEQEFILNQSEELLKKLKNFTKVDANQDTVQVVDFILKSMN